MIRDARFQDIPRIRAILREAYERSDYVKGLCGFDDGEATRLLAHGIQQHGAETLVCVAERNGTVEGFIFGVLSRVYHVGDRNMASDLFWLATENVDPRDPRRLMKAMVAWGRSMPNVVEIRCGATAILQDPESAGRILESLGMDRYGLIYRMEA